jgi:gliding motility-associated lipoprotein GldD
MKADEIFENYISRPGKYGIFYELDGNTATNAQFYITDSTKHFLRGSLYFNAATNQDSIAPVLAYLKKDMLRLIETLEWK